MNLLRMFLAPTIAVGMVSTVPPSDCYGLVVEGYSWGKERHVQRTIEINLVPKEHMSTNVTKKLAGNVALITGPSRSIGATIAKRPPDGLCQLAAAHAARLLHHQV
jgi:hypothetical protein